MNLNRAFVQQKETYWLTGEGKLSDTAVSKEVYAESFLGHKRFISINFLDKIYSL